MNAFSRFLTTATVALLTLAAPQISRADEFSGPQRGEIERIVREYLVAHPEVLRRRWPSSKTPECRNRKKGSGHNTASLIQLAASGGARNPAGNVTL